MENKTDTKFNIADEETLFRLISSPGCISDNGELSPDIFSLYHKDEFYVSMIREFYQSLEYTLPIGENIKKWLLPIQTMLCEIVDEVVKYGK